MRAWLRENTGTFIKELWFGSCASWEIRNSLPLLTGIALNRTVFSLHSREHRSLGFLDYSSSIYVWDLLAGLFKRGQALGFINSKRSGKSRVKIAKWLKLTGGDYGWIDFESNNSDLITYGTVQGVIYKEKFHNSFSCLSWFRRVGFYLPPFHDRHCTRCYWLSSFAGLTAVFEHSTAYINHTAEESAVILKIFWKFSKFILEMYFSNFGYFLV